MLKGHVVGNIGDFSCKFAPFFSTHSPKNPFDVELNETS